MLNEPSMDWLKELTDLVDKKPLIIFRFSQDEWGRLQSSSDRFSDFTVARSHTFCKDVRLPTAGLLIGDVFHRETEVYFALVKSRTSATTLDSRIRFTNARRISPSAEQDLLNYVTKTIFESNLSIRLNSEDLVIPLSPKLSVDLVKQLAAREENREAMRAVAKALDAPRTYFDNIALQQDAINLALNAFRLSPTASAIHVETADDRETALHRVSIREDSAIAHDARIVPGFVLTGSDQTGRAVFRNGTEQLEVITANRGKLEESLGVDLIYLNAVKQNVVMVQYKMLEPNIKSQETDWVYYPDSDPQFQKELSRMKDFSKAHSPGPLEYRINPQVFYLRFVRRDSMLGRSTLTMPIDHFEILRQDPECKGPNGGFRITYDTLDGRYLHQQAFVALVRSGYIGAHANETAELESHIRATLGGGQALVGALQTSLPTRHDEMSESGSSSTGAYLQSLLFDS